MLHSQRSLSNISFNHQRKYKSKFVLNIVLDYITSWIKCVNAIYETKRKQYEIDLNSDSFVRNSFRVKFQMRWTNIL